jgi:hypothetical protein
MLLKDILEKFAHSTQRLQFIENLLEGEEIVILSGGPSTALLTDSELKSMLFHQMSGRAGRRGLDKEGNIIFAGFSWERIKELSIISPPKIIGLNKQIYTIPHANQLSLLSNNNYEWSNIYKNFFNNNWSDEDQDLFLNNIKSNYENNWNFALNNNNINHLYMNWRLRYNNDCLIISFLIPYLERAFSNMDHKDEKAQIQIAHFLSRFICIYEPTNDNDLLIEPDILSKDPYNNIISRLEELLIFIPNKVDNKVFLSIQNNIPIEYYLINRLQDFNEKIIIIQHYCFHSQIITLCKILGKLLTRIWWISHLSLPIMKPLKEL